LRTVLFASVVSDLDRLTVAEDRDRNAIVQTPAAKCERGIALGVIEKVAGIKKIGVSHAENSPLKRFDPDLERAFT
jgi:hypothetical protein